jgi:tetratricopeptide (TPR) repeat protein
MTYGRRLRRAFNKTVAISGLLAAMLVIPAFADAPSDVAKLIKAGQLTEAMTKVDAFLAQRPRDAQMRFLKGVILTEQNKSGEAITVFTRLTEDFPELPEPYNNLAVLYAANGQYEKARAALDTAIRTNPSYATAYENLGDVHAKLASQAYDKALQLDSSNTAAKSKLTLLRTLASANVGKGATSASSAVQVSAKAPVVATVAPPASSSTHRAAPAEVKPVAPVVKSEPIKPTKPAHNEDAESAEVLNVVNNWAKAWSAQDVKSYLSFYGSDFQTPGGVSRKAWADERQARIAGKGHISVKVESPQVTVNGNTATVKFRQIYVSDRLKADSRKILVLTKQGNRWQIKQEHAGS